MEVPVEERIKAVLPATVKNLELIKLDENPVDDLLIDDDLAFDCKYKLML